MESSRYWGGRDYVISNTPQQGINWVGELPDVNAVLIKTRPGSYKEDGWLDSSKTVYHYSFKAKNEKISFGEKANKVLINQPQHHYPILLFSEKNNAWHFEGAFSVSGIEDTYVVLCRGTGFVKDTLEIEDEVMYREGGRRYVTHLMAERSKEAVAALKKAKVWICDICKMNFSKVYGVPYIEAHHKVPISAYSSRHIIGKEDLVLLCPNCHKAVHIYMKSKDLEYNEIKEILSKNRISERSIRGGMN